MTVTPGLRIAARRVGSRSEALLDPVAFGSEAPCVEDEVRITEVYTTRAPQLADLLPLDQPVGGVVPDEHDEVETQSDRRLELLRVEHEAAVAGDGQDGPIGMDQAGRYRSGQGDAHRREAVGDDAGVRALGLVEPGQPHLVGADVADDDVVGTERCPDVVDDLLRLHRVALVVGVLRDLVQEVTARGVRHAEAVAAAALPQGVEAGPDMADHASVDDVVLVDLGRDGMDVDQLVLVSAPQVGMVLDHVVADADDEVGLLEAAEVVVVGLQPRRAQQQPVRGRDDALGHERGHDRDVERLGERHQLVGRSKPYRRRARP